MKLQKKNMKFIKMEKYSDPFINQNILIRISKYNSKDSRLSSANMLKNEIGNEIAEKLFDKFFKLGTDKHIFKLRKKLEVVFITK